MGYAPRRLYDDDQPDGYLESDLDYMSNNRYLAVSMLDAFDTMLSRKKELQDKGEMMNVTDIFELMFIDKYLATLDI